MIKMQKNWDSNLFGTNYKFLIPAFEASDKKNFTRVDIKKQTLAELNFFACLQYDDWKNVEIQPTTAGKSIIRKFSKTTFGSLVTNQLDENLIYCYSTLGSSNNIVTNTLYRTVTWAGINTQFSNKLREHILELTIQVAIDANTVAVSAGCDISLVCSASSFKSQNCKVDFLNKKIKNVCVKCNFK